jgi:hypothetical protein
MALAGDGRILIWMPNRDPVYAIHNDMIDAVVRMTLEYGRESGRECNLPGVKSPSHAVPTVVFLAGSSEAPTSWKSGGEPIPVYTFQALKDACPSVNAGIVCAFEGRCRKKHDVEPSCCDLPTRRIRLP